MSGTTTRTFTSDDGHRGVAVPVDLDATLEHCWHAIATGAGCRLRIAHSMQADGTQRDDTFASFASESSACCRHDAALPSSARFDLRQLAEQEFAHRRGAAVGIADFVRLAADR